MSKNICLFLQYFVLSLQVVYFANMGDFQTSIRLSDSARYWTRATVVLGIVSNLMIIIIVVVTKLIL